MTPENFGRIAAQTAKQVILQRIREAERAMMYEEYVDRVGEVVTGIVQQAGDRNNVLVDLGRWRRCCRARSRSTASGTSREAGSRPYHGGSLRNEGPSGDPLAPRSGADPDALRARGPGGRGRSRGDPRSRPRARLPVEDRSAVARPGRRPGRRLRRAARVARADGGLGAPGREDRHHPVESRARSLHRQGSLAGTRARGAHRRRGEGSHRRSSQTTSSRWRSGKRA